MKFYQGFCVIFSITVLSACSSVGYYSQSAMGQLSLWWNAEPISDLLEDEATNAQLKQRLQQVLEIRRFASERLALPDNDSYREYVALDRPYVVWNVVAAPELSLQMHEWCFPIVGCLRYRGYFAEADAQALGQEMRQQGLDVAVYGVAAYSTLGWFDDPMLSTILKRNEAALAGLVFHELAHQQLFVKGDTAFNEGFAKTVEIVGVQRWLQQRNSPELNQAFAKRQKLRKEFLQLVAATTKKLRQLYASSLSDEQKRQGKADIIAVMHQEYAQLKQSWGGDDRYDKWFAKDVNNARLGAVATYQDYVPAFTRLLEQNRNDLSAFYQAAAAIGDLDKDERSKAIEALLSE
ncbi:MAG: aminopeptidase [Gammaproteobacteria bacterium]|nr:aminopeptidase [Gammaproteobacteria bacterium]MDH5801913.1 aminopeptidase [Gammaproteobacteria bacterium]